MKQQRSSAVDAASIHTRIAAEIFNVPPEQVTVKQRQAGKEAAYAAAFGVEPHELARKLNVSRDEARSMLKRATRILDE